VPWKGTPPLSLRDKGDATFERSRDKAEDALARYVGEARRKGGAQHLTERLIEEKTGRAVQYTRLLDLPERWRNLGRDATATPRYLSSCDAHFRRFIGFMCQQHPEAVYLYEVTPEDAAAIALPISSSASVIGRIVIILLPQRACRITLPGSDLAPGRRITQGNIGLLKQTRRHGLVLRSLVRRSNRSCRFGSGDWRESPRDEELTYVEREHLLGDNGEGALDSSHPTGLSF